MADPMPRDAPVTSAQRPLSSIARAPIQGRDVESVTEGLPREPAENRSGPGLDDTPEACTVQIFDGLPPQDRPGDPQRQLLLDVREGRTRSGAKRHQLRLPDLDLG